MSTRDQLLRELSLGYVQNLAAVESAVLRGQFNFAKVLRATAHVQRALALDIARREHSSTPPPALLKAARSSLLSAGGTRAEVVIDILDRSEKSLASNPDVLESDVAQSLWGCRVCGWVAEGDQPESCALCGALAPEFEWFGPFFGGETGIGRFLRDESVATIGNIVAEVEEALHGVSEETANAVPSEGEWSLKLTLAHMLETDVLFAARVRFILDPAQTGPVPRPRPPWKLHEGKGYEELPLSAVVERYRTVRKDTLALLNGLQPSDWAVQKSGTTIAALGTWMAQHEIGHMQQLRRLAGKPPKEHLPRSRS